MELNEIVLFDDKNFSDVLKDIYQNSKSKDTELKTVIELLTPLIKSAADAAIIMPLVTDCLNTGIKNDEQLVKMLAVVQRVVSVSASPGGSGLMLPEEEKVRLLESIRNAGNSIINSDKELEDEIANIETKIKSAEL